jgi:rhodanese-related sulfurtransferase
MQKAITKQQVQEMPIDKVKLIDIRSIEEYERSHIPDVVNIPSENLASQLAEFDKEDTIVCVCNYGKERSQQAAGFLSDAGFKNSFYLQGGTAGWYD